MPPKVVLFSDIVDNAGPFPTRNFPKSHQNFWLNGKSSLILSENKQNSKPISICPKLPCEAYIISRRASFNQ